MAIEGDVQAVLGTLVSGNCFPLLAPDSQHCPYITYQVISNVPQNTLEGDSGLSNRRFQVDVWADTYAAAKTLARAVDTAIAAASFSSLKLSDSDLYEGDTKIYRVSMDFSVWGES